MLKEIHISSSHKELLLNHAKNQKPYEACALLFGKEENGMIIVKEIFITQNIENSSISFSISNEQLIKAYNLAEMKRLEIVGIFHSHPISKAYPSSTDEKFMFTNPVVWIILGEKNDMRAFILDSKIVEIPIIETLVER